MHMRDRTLSMSEGRGDWRVSVEVMKYFRHILMAMKYFSIFLIGYKIFSYVLFSEF